MARILVVEDEAIIAMSIQRSLEKMGHTVVDMVFTGEKAIELAEKKCPDLVLMDIKLEGEVDGVEAAQEIYLKCDIPVIYLTAYADDQTVDRAKITEPFGYILKPLEEKELHSAIEVALYKHEAEKKLQAVLEQSRIKLEKEVEERTKELRTANKELRDEIMERQRVEEELKRKEADLRLKSSNLEESNTALKVLLKQREDDKRELEEKVVSNVKALVLPYVDKLRNSRLDPVQSSCLDMLEAQLRDILSPFLKKMALFNLTPKEIQIASLIKEGKSTKEIAELLNIATSSVDFHRHNIRIKLQLTNEKINLQSYLLSLD